MSVEARAVSCSLNVHLLVWGLTLGMKQCVGGRQKKRGHLFNSTAAAERTVPQTTFLSPSSHVDVEDVSAVPARTQGMKRDFWQIHSTYLKHTDCIFNIIICYFGACFYNLVTAWFKRTPRPAALQQLRKHLCHPEEKATVTLQTA